MANEEPKKRIEMICMGNQGRSPPAELVGQNFLVKWGIDHLYITASSGTLVEAIKTGTVKTEDKIFTIKAAMGMTSQGINVYTPLELQSLDAAMKTNNDEMIDYFFKKAAPIVNEQEVAHRTAALNYFKIKGQVKTEPEQTVARKDAHALFTMSGGNLETVRRIYKTAEIEVPIIGVLSRYARNDPSAGLPDAYGKGEQVYFAMFARLLEDVPRALDRLLREHP